MSKQSVRMPRISVIVAVYERAQDLEKVLVGLQVQRFTDFEIVIADDGSGAEVKRMIRKYSRKFAYPIIHKWHEDKGFRKTVIVNQAVAQSQSDYLVFIDGDCVCHSLFLERHWARKTKGAVLFGRRVHFNEYLSKNVTLENIACSTIENPRFWWKHAAAGTRHHGFYLPWLFSMRNAGHKKYSILGSNFSLHKTDYEAVNGYDERIIGRGMEDSNLWARLKLHGIRSFHLSHEAIQYHLYHHFDPIPHDKATVRKFCNPESAWTQYGMNPKGSPRDPGKRV